MKVYLSILVISSFFFIGCKKEGSLKFSKHIKSLKGTWEMTSIKRGDDKVDFYPQNLTVTFYDCSNNPACFADLVIDSYPTIQFGFNLGKPGIGDFSVNYREHAVASGDTVLKAFLEDISWWVNTIDKEQMSATNQMIGYDITLKKLKN